MSLTPFYYFGCLRGAYGHNEAGHYLRTPDLRMAPSRVPTPWGYNLDGALCPAESKGQHQGKANFHQKDGWTAIAFWDRTGDARFGSNSAFLTVGDYTFEEMCILAEQIYPELWKRFGRVVQC